LREVTTMVLIPEVIDAIEGAVPVLAAGGIVTGRQMAAAVAMGADGAWNRIGVADDRGGRDGTAHGAEVLAATSRGHHPLRPGVPEKPARQTEVGVDGRVGAQ